MEGLAYLLIFACIYLLPAIIASVKGRPNAGAIWALNLLAGWTFVGWVVSFIWALTSGRPPAPSIVVNTPGSSFIPAQATKRCPSCAEEVLRDAKKCRHCGELFVVAAAPTAPRAMAMGWCPGCGRLRGDGVQKCVYCGDTSPVSASAPS